MRSLYIYKIHSHNRAHIQLTCFCIVHIHNIKSQSCMHTTCLLLYVHKFNRSYREKDSHMAKDRFWYYFVRWWRCKLPCSQRTSNVQVHSNDSGDLWDSWPKFQSQGHWMHGPSLYLVSPDLTLFNDTVYVRAAY